MSKEIIQILRKKMITASYYAKEGHIASALSVLDILYVLYEKVLNINSNNLHSPNRDYLILSKGHASLAHAVILELKKFISEDQFKSYCSFDSILGGHLNRKKVPGVESSTGSLGHGIGVSIGIAMSSKIQNKKNRIFVIVGDGEANEGTFWESLLLASHHKLDNLCCIVDYNHSNDRALKLDPLYEKLKSFGWHTRIMNGHSHLEIKDNVQLSSVNKPLAIIANTVKGKGVKRMENNHEWHHKYPNKEEYESIIKELSQ